MYIRDNKKRKTTLSIIIVNYQVKKELFTCISSIINSNPKTAYEIIVVDNDEKKSIDKELKKKFPKVVYIPNENKGFGQGNNLGAKFAKGDFLFFLNPDTTVFSKTIDSLVDFLHKHLDTAIVSPLLLGQDGQPYQQGSLELNPTRGIFALSFVNKIFSTNPISKKYFLQDWDRKSIKEVDVAPATAFVIRKSVFEKVDGFDERFFLFFEEFDLCKGVKELGWKIYITPLAKASHVWGASTKQRHDIKSIFEKSRFYYFRKHFGILPAILTESILRINKYSLFLIAVIVVGLFLRLYRINDSMVFIGDQGWFYLSARDIFLSGKVPLVGITSSHTWIHQGPLWTYLLAPVLFLSGFNPVSGAYLSAIIDIGSIVLLYKIGRDFFSKRIALISSLIYASSPLVIMNSRMPYHTSPIPFFVLLLMLSILIWAKGNRIYFPIALFTMSVLYNFELATVVFWPAIICLLLFGYFKNKKWVLELMNKKVFFISILALLLPMVPVIIYDFYNGFPQTLKFAAWFVYKGFQFIGIFPSRNIEHSYYSVFSFFINSYSKLIFLPNIFVSLVFLVLSVAAVALKVALSRSVSPLLIIFSITFIGLVGFFLSRTPSDAYLPMLFPGLIIIFAYSLNLLYPKFKYSLFVVLFFIIFLNTYFFLKNVILSESDLRVRLDRSNKVLKLAEGDKYNLRVQGPGSEFESSTMNYEYLTWWLGNNPPIKTKSNIRIVVSEIDGSVKRESLGQHSK